MADVIEAPVLERDRYDLAIARLARAPRQDRAVRTVRSMLIAADQMIDRDGFDRLTTADVAAAAGVSIGILYRYFADRVAILDALYPDRYALLRPGALEAHDAEVKAQALDEVMTHLVGPVVSFDQLRTRAAALRAGRG